MFVVRRVKFGALLELLSFELPCLFCVARSYFAVSLLLFEVSGRCLLLNVFSCFKFDCSWMIVV